MPLVSGVVLTTSVSAAVPIGQAFFAVDVASTAVVGFQLAGAGLQYFSPTATQSRFSLSVVSPSNSSQYPASHLRIVKLLPQLME